MFHHDYTLARTTLIAPQQSFSPINLNTQKMTRAED